jgi:hypothetical protein
MRKLLLLLTAWFLGFAAHPGLYASNPKPYAAEQQPVSPASIVTDFFIVRPIALLSLVTAVPVATVVLPLSLITGNGKQVAREILGKPFHHTFRRQVGDFHDYD